MQNYWPSGETESGGRGPARIIDGTEWGTVLTVRTRSFQFLCRSRVLWCLIRSTRGDLDSFWRPSYFWATCLAWFWEVNRAANIDMGLSVGLVFLLQALSLLKTRAAMSSASVPAVLNVAVAAVLAFAFPVAVSMIACSRHVCS